MIPPLDFNGFVKFLDQTRRIEVDSPPFYPLEEKIEKIEKQLVAYATELLNKLPRSTPRFVYKSSALDVFRHWSKHWLRLPEIEKTAFNTALLAWRLGITVDNLKASEGLEEFASKDFTYNTLAFYRHQLRVADSRSAVQILVDNEYVDWSIAKSTILNEPDVPGLWPWKYGPRGLHNKDLAVWSRNDYQERAFTHKKHPSPGNYLFSFCVHYFEGKPKCVGSHSWVRLTAPDGKIYEFAIYRPPNTWRLDTALVRRPATIQCPDYSSWYPVSRISGTARKTMHFTITQQGFERALEYIFRLQDNREDLTFAMMEGNCVQFTRQVGLRCDIDIDSRQHIIKLLAPPRVIQVADKIEQFVPKIIIALIYFIPALLTNLVLAKALGGNKPGCDQKPYYSTIRDHLNPNKQLLAHPWYVIERINKRVESSRPPGEPFGIPVQFRARSPIEELD